MSFPFLSIPKPPRRGRKPPKRIQRNVRPARVRKATSLRVTMPRVAKGKLRELADDLQSLYIRHRDKWICRVCGSQRFDEMQAMHLFAKSEFRSGRYLEANLMCGCRGCHRYYTDRPTAWDMWLRGKLGDQYEVLRNVCMVRSGPHDYVLLALYYRDRVEKMRDSWKVSDRLTPLIRRGQKLGVFR